MTATRRWPMVLVVCFGVACLVAGAVLLVLWPSTFRATEVGALAPPVGTAAVAPGRPLAPGIPLATDRPVGGVVPAELLLPTRATSAPIVPVGTDPTGALVVPDPPSTVGWWAPGALPGSAVGTVVLAGHVDSRVAGLGVFAVLPELAVGEPVMLRGANGRTVDYRVVARREYAKAALPQEVFARDGVPRLVLITCGGRFDPGTRSYDDNVVVYAEPVPPA